MSNEKKQTPLTIDFDDAGFIHHATVGKTPNSSGAFYGAAVNVGNSIISGGAAMYEVLTLPFSNPDID